MSHKRRKSTFRKRSSKPLIKGKFYRINDTNGGHYSRLYKKNTKKNKYWIVLLPTLMEGIEEFCSTKLIRN